MTLSNAEDVDPHIKEWLAKKEQQLAQIEQMVERYEKKRAAEELAFRSMSPLRRMLTGKKPDHHLAVEYIHYVKKPKEQAKLLRKEIEKAKQMLQHMENE